MKLNECIICPKEDYLKRICKKRDYPFNTPKLKYLNEKAQCIERIKLLKKKS